MHRDETIDIHSDLANLDRRSLHALPERAFGRTVMPSHLDDLDPLRLYITADYSTVAIVTEELGVPYLDKFAVTAESQGLGLCASLGIGLPTTCRGCSGDLVQAIRSTSGTSRGPKGVGFRASGLCSGTASKWSRTLLHVGIT